MTAPRLALALLLALPTAACSSSAPGPAQPDPAHADVIFQGTATDAALTAMLAVSPADDPANAAMFDNPKDLSEIPPSPVITFAWHGGQPVTMGAGEPEYLLAFRTLDTDQALFRVFTSATTYTPDEASWAKVATGTWTTLQVTSAVFDRDLLAAGTTPIRGQLVKFCVGTWK